MLTEEERLGTRLGGRYELHAILGRGGMGVVYDATHVMTGRRVAVKLLRTADAADRRRAERLVREARAAAALDHDHVVDVLDMGETEDGVFLVLERLEGEDLADRLDRGTIPPAEAVSLVTVILDALEVAHGAGIVHRDVKPSNVFLAQRGGRIVPKLLDFGVAKLRENVETLTSEGTLVGTPHYMSPEQAAGDRDVGPEADVWAVAVLLYECLTGALPYDGPTPTAVLVRILRDEPAPLPRPDLPHVTEVVAAALRKDRTERLDTARGLAEALRRAAAQDLAVEATGGTLDAPVRRSSVPGLAASSGGASKHFFSGAAAILALAGAVALFFALRPAAPEPAASEPVDPTASDVAPTPAANPAGMDAGMADPMVAEPTRGATDADRGAAPPAASGSPEPETDRSVDQSRPRRPPSRPRRRRPPETAEEAVAAPPAAVSPTADPAGGGPDAGSAPRLRTRW